MTCWWAFKFEGGSDRARFLVGPFSPIAAERIRWYETSRCCNLLAAIAGILFAFLLASAIYQVWGGHARTADDRWARPLLAVAGVLLTAFVIGLRRVIASKDLTLSTIPRRAERDIGVAPAGRAARRIRGGLHREAMVFGRVVVRRPPAVHGHDTRRACAVFGCFATGICSDTASGDEDHRRWLRRDWGHHGLFPETGVATT